MNELTEWTVRAANEILRKVEGTFEDPRVLAAVAWFDKAEHVGGFGELAVHYHVQPFPFVPDDACRAQFEHENPGTCFQWHARKDAAT